MSASADVVTPMTIAPFGPDGKRLVESRPPPAPPREFIVKVMLNANATPFVRVITRGRTLDIQTNTMTVYADLSKRLRGQVVGYFYATRESFYDSTRFNLGREAATQAW
jgi:hypothetical protein